MDKILIAIIAFLIGGGTMYVVTKTTSTDYEKEVRETPSIAETKEVETKEKEEKEVKEETEVAEKDKTKTDLGTSVEKNDITAYHYGTGDTELLFVGGIHGGYSWNTTLVAYELMDYLKKNPAAIPDEIKVTVIPVLNPDGLESVVGTTKRFDASEVSSSEAARVAGRFNTNKVDLNRNFDCQWEEKGVWKNQTVSGGTKPFSEPESAALRDYVALNEPAAVIAWYSSAGGVYASNCGDAVDAETKELTNLYAKAAGYDAFEEFDFYEVTGDMVNWFASRDIPAISVLLTTHEDVEWSKNKAGVEAVFNYYTE